MRLVPDWPVQTERLRLRPFREDDLEALHAIQSREDVTRYLYWGPRSLDEVRRSLATKQRGVAIGADGDALAPAVERRDTGELIGDLTLWVQSEAHRQGEIGFVFHPDHQGQGFATEASAALLALGFDGLGLHRITGRLDARNTASARVLERLGMRREAHLIENEWVRGTWTDEIVYALLAREWRERRG